jgi:hypothetical protein
VAAAEIDHQGVEGCGVFDVAGVAGLGEDLVDCPGISDAAFADGEGIPSSTIPGGSLVRTQYLTAIGYAFFFQSF